MRDIWTFGWILIPNETQGQDSKGSHLKWNMFLIWDQKRAFSMNCYTIRGTNAIPFINSKLNMKTSNETVGNFFCERCLFSRGHQNPPIQVKTTLLSSSYSMFFLADWLKENSVPRRTLKGLKCSVRSPKVGPLRCGTLPISDQDFQKILLMLLLLRCGSKETKNDNKRWICFSIHTFLVGYLLYTTLLSSARVR